MRSKIALLFVIIVFLGACDTDKGSGVSGGSSEFILATISVDEFEKKLSNGDVQLIDVRTAEEFTEGYIKGAANIDANSNDFDTKITTYDKNKPVLVYCLSGGRSTAAANRLSDRGFRQVFNMEGGIMKWEASNKSLESTAQIKSKIGMDKEAFLKVVSSNKKVLVDFNAKWCAPCKKMLPMLEALAEENRDKFTLVQIDADENKTLLKDLAIDGVPYFHVYENGKLTWSNAGLTEEQEIKKALNLK